VAGWLADEEGTWPPMNDKDATSHILLAASSPIIINEL
jgi:hypothetical protein